MKDREQQRKERVKLVKEMLNRVEKKLGKKIRVRYIEHEKPLSTCDNQDLGEDVMD